MVPCTGGFLVPVSGTLSVGIPPLLLLEKVNVRVGTILTTKTPADATLRSDSEDSIALGLKSLLVRTGLVLGYYNNFCYDFLCS